MRIRAVLLVGLLAAGLVAQGGVKAEYARREAGLAPNDVAARYRLALWCQEQGLAEQARAQLRAVVALDPDHRAARRALGFEKVAGRWVSGAEKMRAKGFVLYDGRWVTQEEKDFYAANAEAAKRAHEEREAADAALAELAGKEPAERSRGMARIDALSSEARLRALSIAARMTRPDVRLWAVSGLGERKDAKALPALYKRAIFDPVETVRRAAVAAIARSGVEGRIGPFVAALNSALLPVRLRAIEALGALGDAGAVGPLLKRYTIGGGTGQSVYIAQVHEISFLKDFDVEVAQTSFIADPVMGVLQEGTVLNARVGGISGSFDVYERPALVHALQALTGQKFGTDLSAWLKWYRQAHARQRHKPQ